MIIVGHRGSGSNKFNKNFQENTLESFENAFETGAHFVETDLRITKDSEIILHHDPHLNDKREMIDSLNLNEIKKDYPFVPTLNEVLGKFNEDKFKFVLEIKPNSDYKQVIEVLFQNYPLLFTAPQRFHFISFSLDALKLIKQKSSNAYCNWIVTSLDYDPGRTQLKLRIKDIEKINELKINEISGHPISFTKSIRKKLKNKEILLGIGVINTKLLKFLARRLEPEYIYTDILDLVIQKTKVKSKTSLGICLV